MAEESLVTGHLCHGNPRVPEASHDLSLVESKYIVIEKLV